MSSYAKISTSLYCFSNVNGKLLRKEKSILSLMASRWFKYRFPRCKRNWRFLESYKWNLCM